ncbi:hypothetical protein [Actinomycetospora succinea]|uniref:hypothetical protein n=1 Tax=Actinomycetospora succinea TaxID=663603 RepID=UPI00105DFABB|nr:hypothetical protein [Actinomycetospora succinea]
MTDGSAVDGSPSDDAPSDETATSTTTPAGTPATPAAPSVEDEESAGDAAEDETDAADDPAAGDPADDDPAAEEPEPPVVAHVPAQAAPVHETTRGTAGPGPVPDDAGGRLTARLREARARLQPEQTVIPAPRTPEGVVPPAPFRRAGPPPADLLRAVDELAAQLVEVEDAGGQDASPERRALLRALDRSAAGVPDGGWSGEDRVDAEALAGASDLAVTLHDAAASLVERLDAEERTGSAVEVDAVATALQVARMVLDLEGFARHGR